MSNELYTIIVSGERLVFTRDQIVSDPGNYFATYFFGDFAEGSRRAREIIVQKDIQLFKLIQSHLRGYRILPLADNAIPSYMTKEAALLNLFLEAQYYGLQRLEERIRRYMPNIVDLDTDTPLDSPRVTPPRVNSSKRYKFATRLGGSPWIINDSTLEGYRFLFELATAATPGKRFVTSYGLNCPGFTQVLSWVDGINSNTQCALLESDPV